MNFSKWIIKLKKKKIVSEKPHPIIPFILVVIIFGLTIYGKTLENKKLDYFMYFFVLFTFLFAIGHWIVSKIIKKGKFKR